MLENGGKMLRPAFLILASRFGECDSEKIHNIAAVIEMLHMATLVHDDIIDDSKLRRGCDTIQSNMVRIMRYILEIFFSVNVLKC